MLILAGPLGLAEWELEYQTSGNSRSNLMTHMVEKKTLKYTRVIVVHKNKYNKIKHFT